MALDKFIWKNGVQIEPAKVTVDGVVYEVAPEQYEGETPISAANMNQAQDKIFEQMVTVMEIADEDLPNYE